MLKFPISLLTLIAVMELCLEIFRSRAPNLGPGLKPDLTSGFNTIASLYYCDCQSTVREPFNQDFVVVMF